MKKLDISKLTVPTGIFNTSGKAGVLFKDYLKSALKYLNVGYTDSCCNETFVAEGQTSGGGLESVTGFGVDNTDPLNPIVNKYQVDSVTSAGTNFATATQIYSPISSIVSGANNSGVKLPSSPNENEIYVIFSQSTTFGFIVYSTDSFLNQMIVNNQSVSSFTISPNDFSTYTFRYMGGAWSVNQEQVAPYKVYSAEFSQSGTSAPTVVIKQNEVGSIVWSRSGAGDYRGTLTGAFSSANFLTAQIIYLGNNGAFGGVAQAFINKVSNDEIRMLTQTGDLTNVDNLLINSFIEIRVYN